MVHSTLHSRWSIFFSFTLSLALWWYMMWYLLLTFIDDVRRWSHYYSSILKFNDNIDCDTVDILYLYKPQVAFGCNIMYILYNKTKAAIYNTKVMCIRKCNGILWMNYCSFSGKNSKKSKLHVKMQYHFLV